MSPSRLEDELAQLRARIGELGRGLDQVTERIERVVSASDPAGAGGPGEGRDPSLIAFVHIPKTAGATVSAMFANAYSRRALHNAGNFMRSRRKTVGKAGKRPGGWESWMRSGGRVVVGHTPYSVFREHMPVGTQYITFLREPVDRALSHYYRHIHRPELSTAEQEERRELRRKETASSIEEAIAEMRLPHLRNLAVRFLGDGAFREPSASALAAAKENLREFAVVGIQERFEESVALLQRSFGLGPVAYGEHRHVSLERPAVDEVSAEQRALIEAHNELDIELYAFGRRLFEEALESHGQELVMHLEELRTASAAARERDRAALQEVNAWIDVELPIGAIRSRESLYAAAAASNVSAALLKRAIRQTPGVETVGDDTADVRLIRTESPHTPSEAELHRRKSENWEDASREAGHPGSHHR